MEEEVYRESMGLQPGCWCSMVFMRAASTSSVLKAWVPDFQHSGMVTSCWAAGFRVESWTVYLKNAQWPRSNHMPHEKNLNYSCVESTHTVKPKAKTTHRDPTCQGFSPMRAGLPRRPLRGSRLWPWRWTLEPSGQLRCFSSSTPPPPPTRCAS